MSTRPANVILPFEKGLPTGRCPRIVRSLTALFKHGQLANSTGRSNRSPGFLVPELLALHPISDDERF
jgi:hypothetical protein